MDSLCNSKTYKNQRLKLRAIDIILEFRTGAHAQIGTVNIREGATLMANVQYSNLRASDLRKIKIPITTRPEVTSALAICVDVVFNEKPLNALGVWVEFVSVGIDLSRDGHTFMTRKIVFSEFII